MCSVPSYQWQSVLAVKYVPQTSIEKHHYLLINILPFPHVTKIKINNLFTNPFNWFKSLVLLDGEVQTIRFRRIGTQDNDLVT